MRHGFIRSAFLFVGVLAVAGCGDDDDNGLGPGNGNGDLGSMTATVTGHVSETFTGDAIFVMDAEEDWALYLGNEEDGESLIWFSGIGGRPGTGSYPIDADSDVGVFYANGAGETLYIADEGTLVVTSSSSSRVVGTFEFTAPELGGAGRVNVEGSFNAVTNAFQP